jgi:hypothetical protein
MLVPAEVLQDPAAPVVLPRRKRFTRSDVARLNDAGVFEGQRYEMIEGDLIDKTGRILRMPLRFAGSILGC